MVFRQIPHPRRNVLFTLELSKIRRQLVIAEFDVLLFEVDLVSNFLAVEANILEQLDRFACFRLVDPCVTRLLDLADCSLGEPPPEELELRVQFDLP